MEQTLPVRRVDGSVMARPCWRALFLAWRGSHFQSEGPKDHGLVVGSGLWTLQQRVIVIVQEPQIVKRAIL